MPRLRFLFLRVIVSLNIIATSSSRQVIKSIKNKTKYRQEAAQEAKFTFEKVYFKMYTFLSLLRVTRIRPSGAIVITLGLDK